MTYALDSCFYLSNNTIFPSDTLELCDDWAPAWNTFIDGIQNASIRLTSELDDLIWIENKFGTVTVADLYKQICVSHLFDEVP